MDAQTIVIRGAREHNLQNINLELPRNRLIVFTGVSGSGKSSLAFDTLYAEGQRRYVESLSAYARQFLERMEKPALDGVDGVCPAIAIRQRTPARNPRSTVATATEVHDHLRLLFARIGHTFCDSCGSEVARDTAESVTERLLGLPPGTRLLLGFPVWAGGMPPADVFERLRKRGFSRLLQGQEVVSLEEGEAKGAVPDPLVVLVDRLEARGEARSRLTDSVETALAEGGGQAQVQVVGGPLLSFSESFSCARCARSFPEPQPSLFSFNNPVGACPTCHGFGNLIQVDLDLVIPVKEKSLAGGAVEPWNKPHYRSLLADLKR